MNTITVSDNSDREILSSIKSLISGMSADTKTLLRKRFERIAVKPCFSEDEQRLADEIAGKSYSPEESKEIEFSNLINSFAMRNELLKGTVSGVEVAKLLNCTSRQTPLDRVKNQSLLAVKDNGKWKYPLWQFDANGAERVIDGLPSVIAALEVSNLSKISWLTRPNSVFDGKTPVEMLKKQELARVLTEAKGLGIGQ